MVQNYFDKIFCINLDKRVDRWNHFEKQSNKFNISEYERISAVDGDTIDVSQYPSKFMKGEIGLLLTSINVFEKAIELNLENFLIFEDDCLINENILELDSYFSFY